MACPKSTNSSLEKNTYEDMARIIILSKFF